MDYLGPDRPLAGRGAVGGSADTLAAVGMKLLPIVLVMALPLGAQAPSPYTWGNVLVLPPESRVRVQLIVSPHAPIGTKSLRGTLISASGEAVVLRSKRDAMHSLTRSQIHSLKVYQPPRKRYMAQAATCIAAIGAATLMHPDKSDEFSPSFALLVAAVIVGPVAYAAFRGLRWKLVYRVG